MNPESRIIEWNRYYLQFLIWGAIVIIAKIFSFVIQSILQKPMMALGSFIFGGIKNPNVQLVLVLVIIPLILDIFQVFNKVVFGN